MGILFSAGLAAQPFVPSETKPLPAKRPSAAAHPALQQYCLGCHNSNAKAGGLVLEELSTASVAAHAATWEKVAKRLRARSMPPAGLPRPKEPVYQAWLANLETELDQAAAAKPNPGRTDTFRRLNRTEYRNAVRDLLHLDIDVSQLLPSDEASRGFDNITVGDLSPTLLERYLNAAKKISRLALGIPSRAPGGETILYPPDLTQEQHFDGLPFGTRGGALVPHTFPVDAEYEIQLRLARDRNEHVEGLYEPHEVELLIDGAKAARFTVKPPAAGQDHSQADKHLNLRVPLKAGPHTLAITFLQKTTALLETERQPYQAHFNMDRHPRPQPALYSVSINGPYAPQGPGNSPSRRRILVCTPTSPAQETACAQQIFKTLARRAFRRPVTAADIAAPMRFFRQTRAQEGFDESIEMGLRAILVSPEFLFRISPDPKSLPPGTPYRLDDLALASRLSFFLWSSIPDDTLLQAAESGQLRTKAGLERQVRRMLADGKAKVLVNNFAEQWLYLRNLASATPDMRLFTDFDDNLRRAFRQETELFVGSVIQEDRSVLELLRANYTYLNERLAKHYGVPNIYGSRFRRVAFAPGSDLALQRGGLLRHGSILTVTSYATRTSPVLRGKWIMDNLLGTPPPPPPAAVPALKEKAGFGKNLSMRERMAEHRENPACSGCHQLMDPVGFALENYDAVGRWRTQEDGRAVDVAGGLPDGSKFSGAAGLQTAILARPELFAGALSEKLLTYALGRGVETYDGPAIRSIVRHAQANDFRFSALVVGIVNSTPFQMRRTQ